MRSVNVAPMEVAKIVEVVERARRRGLHLPAIDRSWMTDPITADA